MLKDPQATAQDIVKWIQAYFESACKEGSAVIGISGGKDSSTTAALCVRALGKDRVLGVLMPNGVQRDIDDARLLVKTLDIPSLTVNIGKTTSTLIATLEASEDLAAITGVADLSRDTLINMPARIRMTTLYAIAQSLPHGGLVVNTCNRSEDYVGYSTKFGDAAGDLGPISGLLVEEVRQIGEVLGLPSRLVGKVPSDGLSGLDDEQKLGFTYATLDRYIQTGQCDDETTRRRIDIMHIANLHKIMPMPTFKPADEAYI